MGKSQDKTTTIINKKPNQKKQMYPFRKQFTMPKRLPSTNYDNMLEDVL